MKDSAKHNVMNTTVTAPVAQIIPGRLYFTSSIKSPRNDVSSRRFVHVDDFVHYDAFYDDFGPLNLSVLYRFCQMLNDLLQEEEEGRKIFLYTSICPKSRTNAIYMIAAYMIIYRGISSEEAYIRVQAAQPPDFIGFRDAAMGPPTYTLHVFDVIKAVEKACALKWLQFDKFDPDEYEFYERVENGDLNWIIDGRVLSFCGPHDRACTENGYPYHCPESYFEYFREHNVTTVIRLNKKIYDAKRFTNAGFEHFDLFFIDGSTPNDEIVLRFIEVLENAPGAVAIHCKAGLGRTGTLIACWMMKNFHLTAAQTMAWLRICRPGSVIGPQQQFLIDKQSWCWKLGNGKAIHSPNKEMAFNKLSTIAPTNASKGNAKNVESASKNATVKPLSPTYQNSSEKVNGNRRKSGEGPKSLPISPTIAAGSGTSRRRPPSKYLFNNCGTSPTRQKNSSAVVIDGISPVCIRSNLDETVVNDHGQSQGDRLLEKKAKMQKKMQIQAIDSLPKSHIPEDEALVADQSREERQRQAVPAIFSSATTPIKQLRLSMVTRSLAAAQAQGSYTPTSLFARSGPHRNPARNLAANESNVREAPSTILPISKVTVRSSKESKVSSTTPHRTVSARNLFSNEKTNFRRHDVSAGSTNIALRGANDYQSAATEFGRTLNRSFRTINSGEVSLVSKGRSTSSLAGGYDLRLRPRTDGMHQKHDNHENISLLSAAVHRNIF